MKINIAKDYTETPGGRTRKEGKFSGEDFRENILLNKCLNAIDTEEKIEVDLDGGYGYGSSFLEEVFGGLIRRLFDEQIATDKIKNLKDRIIVKSDEEPALIKQVYTYMEDAMAEKSQYEK
ncbi:MAG: STAS-like domain-containing protein [Endomicrobiaceae bacterium]|nr:STAS-like domain-containing protein [Endomicrobiaceae bacterium]MDD3922530.1 STAS-like domain-containing protein [Endomicrobiaceae bacterium]